MVKKDMNSLSNKLNNLGVSKKSFEIEMVRKLSDLSVYLKNLEKVISQKSEIETVNSQFGEFKTEMIEEIGKVYDRMYNELLDLKVEIKNLKEKAGFPVEKKKKKFSLFSKKKDVEFVESEEIKISESQKLKKPKNNNDLIDIKSEIK